jgi:hypothetical protein
MAFEHLGTAALDYYPCRYGMSKRDFRGPCAALDQPYCAVIGGSETYGKFVERPYPDLLQDMIEFPVVNLGCMNAGTDVFALDETVMDICANAEITVIQLMGAQNMSNRYYSVHPRRNDRFLNASGLLHAIYRDVDFTDFHFTGHLLNTLVQISPKKFALVREELKETWVGQMQKILDRIDGPVVLLWMADHGPGETSGRATTQSDPTFVDRDMIDRLTGRVIGTVEVLATEEEILAGHDRMIFTALEELVAREMMGPIVHEAVAQKLHDVMPRFH